MAVNTRIQFRRGSTNDWTNSVTGIGQGILYQGELGYDTTTGRFKIGNGTSHWNALPYAGGSDLAGGSGIATIFNSSSNTYTLHNSIVSSGSGISLSSTTFSGNGTSSPSGSGWQIGLSNRLQAVSNLNTSGIIVSTNTSGVITRSLSSGANISISNADGISSNPIIALNSSLTGLSSIGGNNNFTISSNSGIAINAGAGEVWVDDLGVSGTLYIGGNIDISLAANIIAQGPIIYSGNPTIYSGAVYYAQTPYVGPTGGGAVPVSLSGHSHVYSDITNFCSGVASCVDTSLLSGTGIQFISGGNSLTIGLSGQALAIHNLNTNGLVARSADNTFVSRTISPSGSNIWIGNGNGVSDNPSVGLNPNVAISSLGVTNNVDITGNLIIGGNLTVNGDTVVTNVSTVQVEDPVIRIGGTGTLNNSDNKDRGIEFIYQTGNGVPITGFFGFDYSSRSFTLLTNTNNSDEIYTGGTSGLLNVGGLFSSGGISGTVLTSTIASPSAPISVTSTGQVNNLNSDYLDGQHGNYYLNSANLTGTINNSVLPVASTTNSGIVRFDADNFIFNTNGIVSARNIVYTTGVQTVSGVKTFENRPVLNSGLSIKNTTTTSVSGFAVFSGDPTAGTAFTVDYRSIGNIRSDLGTSSNTSDRLVLRDANGNFSAGNISGTDLYASNQTANRVAVFDANKMLFSTGVLTSELTHLTGVTSSIQNQLNSKAASGVSLTAGNGLTGGGSLSGNLSFDVGAGDGISVGTDAVNVNSTVVRTSGSQTISGIKTFTNAIVFQSGLTSSGTLSAQSAASAGPNSFAVFDSSPTSSSVALSSRTLANVRSDLGTSTNTADRLVLRDSNGDFASRYISVTGISGVQTVGSMTSVYTSTSISGLNNTTYLANFIIDGGTP
jgi:hypothetical protein